MELTRVVAQTVCRFCFDITIYPRIAAVGAGFASPKIRSAVSSRQNVVTRDLKINEEISHIRSK